ncbi:SMP-30/gluconolactonase/LRE family protein [Shewanella aestuarii]|uniref:SMP-30/gluconolactonase/LRE family protein n=1 Tax=Shewanella aestuarii TaxID=1028752 RepID=A0A6G9QHS5_9GAMM|nr:SMP-30/gluconolactonase/LRE family protein [Shewanella aestuarii]QIR14090.1 SMP-30/gluconolactonase/LRE family protein [Shewanella aestuarii]
MKQAVSVFDSRVNLLAESPLWHPLTSTLYWVDFPNNLLRSRHGDTTQEIKLAEMATAIAWIDIEHLLLAKPSGLYQFNTHTHAETLLVAIEAQRADLRSNDGRADPWGGFWLGTMSREGEEAIGSIYRWYQSELRLLVSEIGISNGLCFDKSRHLAYFADSAKQQIFSIKLNDLGWPIAKPELFMDFSASKDVPDGAVVDAKGNLWVALWDGAGVVCISAEGELLQRIDVKVKRPTCPAFGGERAHILFVSSAQLGLETQAAKTIANGNMIQFEHGTTGLFEPAVKIK